MNVILASTGKLHEPAYETDGVVVEPLKAEFLEKYRGCFERWAGLDIFYFMLPVAWAAWAQAQEDFDYDLVEATDWALLFAPWVASPKKAPLVISLHGSCGQVDWYSHTGGERSLGGDLVRMAEVVAMRGADAIHANSRMNAEFWRVRTGCEVTVIPPACSAEGSLNRNLTTENTETTEDQFVQKQGGAWASQAGAALSNPSTSALARACENTSPIHSANGPASVEALDAGRSTLASSSALDSGHWSLDSAPKAHGLVVGRLQNWKGAEVLCQALRLVPEIRVEWLGADTDWDGRGTMASKYLARNYPNVWGSQLVWLGRVDRGEVTKKIRDAAFLVVPSLWDVFNLTVAEGMEAGVPVVCSRAAGAEMLIEHGRSGFLFDPAKPEELAVCINQVHQMSCEERSQLGGKAHAAVKTLLDEQRILNLLEESYFEVIKKGATVYIDTWLESLLLPGQVLQFPPKINFARRAIRKLGRILADV